MNTSNRKRCVRLEIYKRYLLSILILFGLFVFSACQENSTPEHLVKEIDGELSSKDESLENLTSETPDSDSIEGGYTNFLLLNLEMPDINIVDVRPLDFNLSSYEELTLQEDFFLTSKGQECVWTAYEFFRYFILGDTYLMDKHFIEPPLHEYSLNSLLILPPERELSDIRHLNLHSVKVFTLDRIQITFEYGWLDEAFRYLYVLLVFQNDEWKVESFVVQ